MLEALLEVVLPVALVAAFGAVLARYVRIEQQAIARLTLYALTPALVLDTLLHTEVRVASALHMIAGYVLAVAVMGLVASLAASRFPGRTRRSVMAAVMIGNNGNFGLPIALFALGQFGFQYSLIVFLASVIMTYTIGPALYGAGGGLASSLRAVWRLPVLWCVVIAVAWRVLELPVPLGVDRGISLLAEAALPVVLFALGLQIGQSGWPRLRAPVVLAAGLRLLVGPAVALGVAWLIGVRGVELQALVLSAAMPTAVNAFLLAVEFDADVPSVAGAVVLSTLGSLLTIGLVVALLPSLA